MNRCGHFFASMRAQHDIFGFFVLLFGETEDRHINSHARPLWIIWRRNTVDDVNGSGICRFGFFVKSELALGASKPYQG